jgi:hypothetical protein
MYSFNYLANLSQCNHEVSVDRISVRPSLHPSVCQLALVMLFMWGDYDHNGQHQHDCKKVFQSDIYLGGNS